MTDAVVRLAEGNPARSLAPTIDPGTPDDDESGEPVDRPDGRAERRNERRSARGRGVRRGTGRARGRRRRRRRARGDRRGSSGCTPAWRAARSWDCRTATSTSPRPPPTIPDAYESAREHGPAPRSPRGAYRCRRRWPSPSGYLSPAAHPDDRSRHPGPGHRPDVPRRAPRRSPTWTAGRSWWPRRRRRRGGPGPDDADVVARRAAADRQRGRAPAADARPAAAGGGAAHGLGADVDRRVLRRARPRLAEPHHGRRHLRVSEPARSTPIASTTRLTQSAAELDAVDFAAAGALTRAGDTLQNLLTLNDQVGGVVRDEAMTGSSYADRRVCPGQPARPHRDSRDWIEDQLGSVARHRAQGRHPVQWQRPVLGHRHNDLDQPVTVRLGRGDRPAAAGRGARRQRRARAGSADDDPAQRLARPSGVRNVTLRLTDSEGDAARLVGLAADPVQPGQQRDLADHRRRGRPALRRDRGPPGPPDPRRGQLVTRSE